MKTAITLWLALAAIAAAKLEFKESAKELTVTGGAPTVTGEFSFTNTGKTPVTISKMDAGCSCTQVKTEGDKRTYAPGESGTVKTTFEVGNYTGIVEKTVAVWLEGDPQEKPSSKLTLRIKIPVTITLEPKTVTWLIGGNSEPKTIHIAMAEGKTIHVLGAKPSSESFTTEVKEIEKGKRYDLIVTPASTSAPGIGVIRIETDGDTKQKTQQVFAVVRKPATGEAAKP